MLTFKPKIHLPSPLFDIKSIRDVASRRCKNKLSVNTLLSLPERLISSETNLGISPQKRFILKEILLFEI